MLVQAGCMTEWRRWKGRVEAVEVVEGQSEEGGGGGSTEWRRWRRWKGRVEAVEEVEGQSGGGGGARRAEWRGWRRWKDKMEKVERQSGGGGKTEWRRVQMRHTQPDRLTTERITRSVKGYPEVTVTTPR
ncbi:hypothetical protein Pcinc_023775 [Petrolisthes cinctipes]|uniref:Uncharacterized protein n=1 Tax=Petrolisthes cinctipes TaxID=88211 RepID=A0AAE1FCG0_PETCI|nr:hypothetical protein Pcinc_023775 [Petrolisthes cinctipes]